MPVTATLKLDHTRLKPGEKTVLRAFGLVTPGVISDSDQIFSWNVDLLVFDSTVARIDAAGLLRPASDRDPATSSAGTPDGADLRGIRDTFLNFPAAGRTEAVELFSVPVIATGSGVARFRLLPGSRGLALESDFLVVPLGDGPIVEGADYTAANVVLNVENVSIEPPLLAISLTPGGKVRIETTLPAGVQWVIEMSGNISSGAVWSALPGGITVEGRYSVDVDGQGGQQFFRARQSAQAMPSGY